MYWFWKYKGLKIEKRNSIIFRYIKCSVRSFDYYRSSGGVVIKLLACGARGRKFDTWSCRYDFVDWLSPVSICDMAEIRLKRRKSSKQPTNQSYRAYIGAIVTLLSKGCQKTGDKSLSKCDITIKLYVLSLLNYVIYHLDGPSDNT